MRSVSPVDHYIQADIVRKLYTASDAIAFSVLKPDGIENSLFSYHLNKLIDRGVVQKQPEGGFCLTPHGVRWVNLMGATSIQPEQSPKTLVNFVILSPDRSHVLVARRVGIAAQHVNEFIYVGGKIPYGTPSVDAATELLAKRNITQTDMQFVGIQEVIRSTEDYAYHAFVWLYTLTLPNDASLNTDERYTYTWLSIDDQRLEASAHIAQTLRQILGGETVAFQLIKSNS